MGTHLSLGGSAPQTPLQVGLEASEIPGSPTLRGRVDSPAAWVEHLFDCWLYHVFEVSHISVVVIFLIFLIIICHMFVIF